MKREKKTLVSEDKAWIEQNIKLGKSLCELYGINDHAALGAGDLDKAFRAWKKDNRKEKPTDVEIINGLGCLFGSLMSIEFGLQWIVVIDAFGTDLALIHPKSTWETYPLSFVAKRVDPRNDELNFIKGMHDMMWNELYKHH